MQVHQPFSLALGLVALAVGVLSLWAGVYRLRNPPPEFRWWWPLASGLLMLAIGLSRVSAAFDLEHHPSSRTLILDGAAAVIGLVLAPCQWVSLRRLQGAKSAEAKRAAA